jgi:methionyl-tRNA formyltransferase
MSNRVVFFGSGPVAAASLRLLARDFEVEAVITKPRPAHHKHPFPVLTAAEELGLRIHTASTSGEVSALFADTPFQSPVGVIIDHGIILSADVINAFPSGIVNSHFSLLPRWKGPDPISFAILNGDAETGVSLMVIAEKLDEGRLIAQESLPLPDDVTTPELTDRLIELSHELLIKTLPAYIKGDIDPYPQPAAEATFSHKLSKADGVIDWSKPAARLEREIRAYAGWPRSRTRLGGTDVIITRARPAPGNGTPGELHIESKELGVYCGEGLLVIESLIPAGKREMPASAFLAGYKLL